MTLERCYDNKQNFGQVRDGLCYSRMFIMEWPNYLFLKHPEVTLSTLLGPTLTCPGRLGRWSVLTQGCGWLPCHRQS